MRVGMSLRGGFFVPLTGHVVVLRHAVAIVVQFSETVLCVGVPLCGGFFVPLAGHVVILRHAVAVVVHDAEAALRGGVPLRRGFFEQLPGHVVVLRHALTVVVHAAEAVLRVGIFLCGGFFEQLPGYVVVLRHAVAVVVFLAAPVPVFRVALLRAAVAAKLCRVGEFLSAFATVDHGYFLMKEGAEEGARPAAAGQRAAPVFRPRPSRSGGTFRRRGSWARRSECRSISFRGRCPDCRKSP